MDTQPLLPLLRTRYGTEISPTDFLADTDAIPTIETILSHHSVRKFRDESLPPGMLELLIACGQSAATSSNLQAWSVVAVEEEAHKSEVATVCGDQDFIRKAPLFLVFCADLARLTDVSTQAGQPGDGLTYTEMFLIAVIDAALAAQNVAIAAETLGLGICYVGAARNQPRELAELLHLPTRTIALFGMTIGWPAPLAEGEPGGAVKPRLPLREILHRETYSATERQENVAEYDTAMRQFYTDQAMKVSGTWSTHSARRVAGPNSLSGRHVLRQILEERGFDLK